VLGVAVSVNAGAAVVYSTARSTRSTPPPKSTPTPEELIIGYLRVTLSWTGHSDRAG
jgi:hypothetical protein